MTRKDFVGFGASAVVFVLTGWLLTGCGQQAASGESTGHGDWLTDVPKALAKAKAENKLVMLDFTGSDWCPPCKLLDKTVFATKEFTDYAARNLVLVELDYPESKPQSPELKKANAELAKKYAIEGYPTVILLDVEGKELSRSVGFGGGTPADFIAALEKAKKKG